MILLLNMFSLTYLIELFFFWYFLYSLKNIYIIHIIYNKILRLFLEKKINFLKFKLY